MINRKCVPFEMKRSVLTLPIFGFFFLMASCDSGGPVPVPPPDLDGLLLDVAGTQGENGKGGDGGLAIACSLFWPVDVTVTPNGELLIVDRGNNRIRKITPDSLIDAFIGSGIAGDDTLGAGRDVDLNSPTEVREGLDGDYYVACYGNCRVKSFDAATLEVSVVAGTGIPGFSGNGGPATAARLGEPSSLVFDPAGNMYIVDQGNTRIRVVDSQTGVITTFVGGTRGIADGIGEAAQFAFPGCESSSFCGRVAIDISSNGEDLYLTDTGNHTIRKINIATRMVTTIAGTHEPGWEGDGGPALSAKLNYPTDLDIAANGDMYIADLNNNVIRKISSSGIITTVAGNNLIGASPSGTRAIEAMFYHPEGIAFDDATNTLYIVDTYNHQIRKVINP